MQVQKNEIITGIKSVSNRENPFIIIENKLEKKGQMDKAVKMCTKQMANWKSKSRKPSSKRTSIQMRSSNWKREKIKHSRPEKQILDQKLILEYLEKLNGRNKYSDSFTQSFN